MHNIHFINKIFGNKNHNNYRNLKNSGKKNCLVYLVENIPSFLETYFYTIIENPNVIYLQKQVLNYVLEKNSTVFDAKIFRALIDSPYFTYDFYKELNEKLKMKIRPDLWELLLGSPIITINQAEMILDKYPKLNLNFIASNPNLTESFLEKFRNRIDLYFYSSNICRCENISIEWIIKNLKKINMRYVSQRKNITEDSIRKWPTLDWYWDILSSNQNISVNFIKTLINMGWDWDAISWRVSETDVKNNPDLPWTKTSFLYNNNMRMKFILENNPTKNQPISLYNDDYKMPDIQFLRENRERVCFFTNSVFVKETYIIENMDLPWEWPLIWQSNKNISIDFIEKNIERVDFYLLSKNPNLTLNFICKYINKNWDWLSLSQNEFLFNPVILKKSMIKDIKKRREKIRNIRFSPDNHIQHIIFFYVGYL